MPDSGYFLCGMASPHGMAVRTEIDGNVRWLKYFNDIRPIYDCQLTEDGNILICDFDMVAKLDDQNEGEILWEIELDNVSVIHKIIWATDNGFLICGTTTELGHGSADMYTAKIDVDGNLEWENAFGTEDEEYCFDAVQTQNGGWCLVGNTQFGLGADTQRFSMVVRIDSAGNLLWQNVYHGGHSNHELYSIVETVDGGFTAAGVRGNVNYYLLRLDYTGEELWFGYYPGSDCYSIILMEDGSYVLGGFEFRSGGTLLVRTEPDPVVIPFELSSSPSYNFGETFVDSFATYELTVTNSGRRYADILGAEVTLGQQVFAVEYGEIPRLFPGDSTNLRLVFSPDSAMAYVGVLSILFGADSVADTLKIDLAGVGIPNVGVRNDEEDGSPGRPALLSVSPNPFNSMLTIWYAAGSQAAPTRLAIHDINGREVFSAVAAPSVTGLTPPLIPPLQAEGGKAATRGGVAVENVLTWDASAVPAGIYLVRLQAGAEVETRKVVLVR